MFGSWLCLCQDVSIRLTHEALCQVLQKHIEQGDVKFVLWHVMVFGWKEGPTRAVSSMVCWGRSPFEAPSYLTPMIQSYLLRYGFGRRLLM